MTERYEALLHVVESLYARLHAGALEATDLCDLDGVAWPDYDDFVVRVYSDADVFDQHFGSFKDAFEVFRGFGEADTVLDVGAHWGYSAIAMRHQGCRARIVSVEAISFNIPPLERLKRIPGSNYDFVQAAASDRPGELTFYVPVLNGGPLSALSSTGKTLTSYFAKEVAARAPEFPPLRPGDADEVRLAVVHVAGRAIDEIVETLGDIGQRVAGLKMDVEGHELAALKGAEHILRAQKPLLMLEGVDVKSPAGDLIRSAGYFHVRRVNGRLVPDEGPRLTSDSFWIHPERVTRYRTLGILE